MSTLPVYSPNNSHGRMSRIGVEAPVRPLPVQDWQLIYLVAERFDRAVNAQAPWQQTAKKAVEYFEDIQWRPEDIAKLEAEGRPALQLNMIKPIVENVYGYHLNNRTDIAYLPGHDGSGTAEVAKALTHVGKQIASRSELPYVDAEVFLEGLLTGRAYYDGRLNFDKNDLGEVIWTSSDPFSTYLDPDAMDYDLNKGQFIFDSKWLSLDEVEFTYGRDALAAIGPMSGVNYWRSGPTNMYQGLGDDITPARRFGGERDGPYSDLDPYGRDFSAWYDTSRKAVRMVDMQHYVVTRRNFFIDLETGDRKPVPDNWSKQKLDRVLLLNWEQGNALRVESRICRRVRWTQMVADIVVYDQWSKYDRFTKVPFFPYFRRGKTKGMVESLFGPQDEINKRRSNRLNIAGRAAAGGWIYQKGTLDAQQKQNLEEYGSAPGVQIEWDSRGGTLTAPQQIGVTASDGVFRLLEDDAKQDMNKIAGMNDAAMGQTETVQSGRAILAKQRGSMVGMEGYLNNYHRTKKLQGDVQLELVQNHYTERRVITIIGEGNNPVQVVINERTAQQIVNDITVGAYYVLIDETPLSRSFLEMQFEEAMRMRIEAGVPVPDDILLELSTVPRKEEIKQRLQQQAQAQAQMQALATLNGGQGGAGGPISPQQAGGKPPPGGQQALTMPGEDAGGNSPGRVMNFGV